MNRVFFCFVLFFSILCHFKNNFHFFFPFTLLSSGLIMYGICKVFDCEYKKRHELHIWIFSVSFSFSLLFRVYAYFFFQPNNIEHNEIAIIFVFKMHKTQFRLNINRSSSPECYINGRAFL